MPCPDPERRHLVIGAGFCGLGAAAALRRHAIPFEVVDADVGVGGNWRHGVYPSAHIISSRRTTEYADFPMPADWPDFPSAAQMLAYLESYADHHRLRGEIVFGTRVVEVAPIGDGDAGWRVVWERDGVREERRYAGVIVANGHHWDKRWPTYPGTFSGEMMHSKDYKSDAIFAGKRVLVIGGGNSACDVAVEAARRAVSSHISMRRGYWFLPKTMLGVPTAELMRPWLPIAAQRAIIRSLVRVIVGRYQDYGLAAPDHRPFEHHPTINSELLHALRHGRITPHPDVRRWDGKHVEFVDGRREEIDLVVCATGFHVSFPFLADGLIESKNGVPQLVGGLVSPRWKNLYVFGVGQPRYGAGPLITAGAEALCTMVRTQARLAHPLGAVLARLGVKAPRTMLQDPFTILRQARAARRLIPRLPAIEAWVMR